MAIYQPEGFIFLILVLTHSRRQDPFLSRQVAASPVPFVDDKGWFNPRLRVGDILRSLAYRHFTLLFHFIAVQNNLIFQFGLNDINCISPLRHNFQSQVVLIWICCLRPASRSGIWTDVGTGGSTSNGWSIHSHKSRYVQRFHLRNAMRFDSDQPNVELNCRYLMSSIAASIKRLLTHTFIRALWFYRVAFLINNGQPKNPTSF